MADSTPRGTALQLTDPVADPSDVVFPASVKVGANNLGAGVSLDVLAQAVSANIGTVAQRLTVNGGQRWKAKYPGEYTELNSSESQ